MKTLGCFRLALAIAGGATMAAGCAEAPFSVHAQDNDQKSLQAALSRMSAPAAGPMGGRPMAFVYAGPERRGDKEASGGEKTLYGYDLGSGQVAFSVPADVRSRFAVGKGVVAHREGEGQLVIRDAQSGRIRGQAALERGETLLGLVADEERVYYVTQLQGSGQMRPHAGRRATHQPGP